VGAEGVYAAALPELGLGVALKIDDGTGPRAAEVAMAAVIEALLPLDAGDAAFLREFSDAVQTNWAGLPVARLQALPALRDALAGRPTGAG
jgi:L-asparaginase II